MQSLSGIVPKCRRAWHCPCHYELPWRSHFRMDVQPLTFSAARLEPQVGRCVSIEQAAQLLGVSRRTVYYRIRDGRLRTIRTLGGSQRVLMDSVEQRAAHRATHVCRTTYRAPGETLLTSRKQPTQVDAPVTANAARDLAHRRRPDCGRRAAVSAGRPSGRAPAARAAVVGS